MRSAPLVLAAFTLVAGCLSGADQPREDDTDPRRESVGKDDLASEWMLHDCHHALFTVRMPASQLRPLVPERYPIDELQPGLGQAAILVVACANATLDDGGSLTGVRQAALAIQVDVLGGFDLYIVEWLADPASTAALQARGFRVAEGSIDEAPSPLLSAALTETRLAAGGSPRATITWEGQPPNSNVFPNQPTNWLQDDGALDRVMAMTLPYSYAGDVLGDHCAIDAEPGPWRDALGPGVTDCSPYLIEGDLGISFPPPDATP